MANYPEDLKGKWIKFKIDEPGQASKDQIGLVHNEHLPASCIVKGDARSRSGAVGGALPVVVPADAAANPNANRPKPLIPFRFTWLKYVRGGVTDVDIGGGVLTGKMSGCYIMTYTFEGTRKVAHVGTVDWDTSIGSFAAKTTWVEFCDVGASAGIPGQPNSKPSMIGGGSPSSYFTSSETEKLTLATMNERDALTLPFVLCYILSVGEMSALLCYSIKAANAPISGEPGWIKIQDVRPMTAQPWGTIRQLRTFRDIRIEDQQSLAGIIKGDKLRDGFKRPKEAERQRRKFFGLF